jgi:hypothetical protein
MQHVLRYLKGTAHLGFSLRGHTDSVGNLDSDYGGDKGTRRSSAGHAFFNFWLQCAVAQ